MGGTDTVHSIRTEKLESKSLGGEPGDRDALAGVRDTTYGAAAKGVVEHGERGKNFAGETTAAHSAQKVVENGFQLVSPDAGTDPPNLLDTIPVDEKKIRELARVFDWACNGGITGLGIDTQIAKQAIKGLSPDEFERFNDVFSDRYGSRYARHGEKWDVAKQLDYEKNEIWSWSHISNRDYEFLKSSIAEKKNEVPLRFRASGESLLKPGSTLSVGLINRVKLNDGRYYGVYIPKNADSRAPVIVAIKGAELGDSSDIINEESGLSQYAEALGTIVVFPHSKARSFELSGLSSITASTWNVPGFSNFPKEQVDDDDDRVYLDNVLDDLNERCWTNGRVGLLGHSDGARFAQIYAGSRPERVAALVALNGTTMEGDPAPAAGVPIKIVHGLKDEMLPWYGGMGAVSARVNAALSRGTNLDRSVPFKQPEIWRNANHCGGGFQILESDERTTIVYQNCRRGDVVVELKKHGNHSIDDKLNDAKPSFWSANSFNRNGRDAGGNARWLKEFVVKNHDHPSDFGQGM